MADLPERPARVLAIARRELTPPEAARERVYARVLAAAGGAAAVTTAAAKVAAGLGSTSVAPPAAASIAVWTLAAKIGAPLLLTAAVAGVVAHERSDTRHATRAALASVSRPLEHVAPSPRGGTPRAAQPAPASVDEAPRATEVQEEHAAPATHPGGARPHRRVSPSAAAAVIPRGEHTGDGESASNPPATTPTPAVVGPSVGGEVRLLQEASQALHAGDPARALETLRAHETAHPKGVLALERLGLRVFALCRAGQVEAARRERARFLAIAADAPMAARVRATCVKDGER